MARLERPNSGAVTVREPRAVVEDDEPKPQHDPGLLPDEDEESAELALSTALTELGEEDQKIANCMVWRIPVNPKDADEYLFKCNVLEFTRREGIDDIARRYGPGDYRIRVYKLNKIYTQKRIKIGAALVPENRPGLEAVNLRAEMSAIAAALEKNMATLVEKIAGAQRAAPSLSDHLKDMLAMKELIGGGASASAPKSMTAQMKETLELAQLMKSTFGGGEGEGPTMGGALMKIGERFLPEILDAMKKAQGNAAGAPALVDNAAQGGEDEMRALKDLQLKMALDFLIDSAVRGLPAETYADVATDKVPADELVRLLDRPDWLTELTRIDERAQLHGPWFTKLRHEIFIALREAGITLKSDAKPATLDAPAVDGAASNVSDQPR